MVQITGTAMIATKAECPFYAANGRHCSLSGECLICQEQEPVKLEKGQEIVLKNFGPLDGTYKIADVRGGKLKLDWQS